MRKIKGFLVFDIETNPDKVFNSALLGDCVYVSKADKAGVLGFVETDLTEWFLREIFIKKYAFHIVYAHNGFRFDYKHLNFKKLADLGFNGKILMDKSKNWKQVEVISPDGKTKWYLQDSLIKFPVALKKLLNTFVPDLPKGDVDFEKEIFTVTDPRHVAYALRDSEGLYAAIEKIDALFIEEIGVSFHDAPTAPGLSLKAFKNFCRVNGQNYETIPEFLEPIFRESYFGGQTLAFDVNWHDDVVALDIHSSYGAAMCNNPMPSVFCQPFTPSTHFEIDDGVMYDAEVFIPAGVFPCLKSRIERNGKILKGNHAGLIKGKWWGMELKLQKEFGGQILALHKAWRFSHTTSILQVWIQKLKGLRAVKGSAKDALGKLLQNSLYGKFAQEIFDIKAGFGYKQPEGADVEYDPEKRDWCEHLWTAPDEKAGSQQIAPIHWGSYITALARCNLNRAILRKPDVVLYCDTDSIFFERENLKFFEDLIGDDYGTWGIESDKSGAFKAYAPKAYFCAGKRKNKGIPQKRFEKIREEIAKENPEWSACEIDNYCANIASVNFIQMRSIHHVQKTGKRGGLSSRKTALPEKIGIGSFDEQGRWVPFFNPEPEPEENRQGNVNHAARS